MANLISEKIRKLLSKYAFKMDVESINEDLTCTICGKLMVNAYQSHCDCKYCRECITRYLDNGNTHCRGGKEECLEEQLVLDKNVVLNIVLNKKVLRARVHCPNKSCDFISTITEMEDHLRLCSQHPAECPYTTIGCGIDGGSRDSVETHIHKESLAHSELLMEVIINLRNEVVGLREELRVNQNEIERDVLGQVEMEKKLRQKEREELVELIGEQRSEIIELKKKVEYVEDDLKKRDVARMAEMERLGALCGEVEAERAVSTKTRGEVETLREEVKRVNASNVRLEAENAEIKRKIIECVESSATTVTEDRRRVDELTRIIDCLNIGKREEIAVGELWFTVDRITERMYTGECFDSPHLYSHSKGYKLRVRVEPGGGFVGDWLCVSSRVCKGEHDDVLAWPCVLAVSVSVVDRDTRLPYKTRVIKYDSNVNNKYSNKPIDTDNPQYPYEWLQLASHSDIRSFDTNHTDSLLFHLVVAR